MYFLLQTSSQVAKLENTVETLRTVLTQKIQSEAQTVCLVTRFVDDLENVFFKEVFNASIILENRMVLPVFSKFSLIFVQQNQQVLLTFREDNSESRRLSDSCCPIQKTTRTPEMITSACRHLRILCNLVTTNARHHGLRQSLPRFQMYKSLCLALCLTDW